MAKTQVELQAPKIMWDLMSQLVRVNSTGGI